VATVIIETVYKMLLKLMTVVLLMQHAELFRTEQTI